MYICSLWNTVIYWDFVEPTCPTLVNFLRHLVLTRAYCKFIVHFGEAIAGYVLLMLFCVVS